MSYESPQALMS